MSLFNFLNKKKRKEESKTENTKSERVEEIQEETEVTTEDPKGHQTQLFMLCMEENLDDLMDYFCWHFGIDREEDGNTLHLQNGTMSIDMAVFTMNTDQEFVEQQKNNIWAYFRSIETEAKAVKINLLHQIRIVSSFISLNCNVESPEEFAEIQDTLLDAMKGLKSLLLVNGGKAVVDKDNKVVLDEQGRGNLEAFMPYERFDPDTLYKNMKREQIDRRNRSMTALRERNIYTMEALPLLETSRECRVRTSNEIAQRAACLLIVALFSECRLGEKMSYEEALEFVKDKRMEFECDQYFSPKEKAYIENPNATEQDQITFSWQYENLYVMEWALGLVDSLGFPDHVCDVPLVVRMLKDLHSVQEIVDQSNPRSLEDILDASDFIYRLDWACVDARVNGLAPFPQADSGVVMEWHKSLNWLTRFGDADWDMVDIPT